MTDEQAAREAIKEYCASPDAFCVQMKNLYEGAPSDTTKEWVALDIIHWYDADHGTSTLGTKEINSLQEELEEKMTLEDWEFLKCYSSVYGGGFIDKCNRKTEELSSSSDKKQ